MLRFNFSAAKAREAVEWMLTNTEDGRLDFHTILKAAYFADRDLLNSIGRPVFGATYRAMNYGPVPIEMYEMLKCEPYWLSELGIDNYSWEREGYHVRLREGSNRAGNLEYLCREDQDVLQAAFRRSREITFNERTAATHLEDWRRGMARFGGIMLYEDMIDRNNPRRGEIIEYLRDCGQRIVL